MTPALWVTIIVALISACVGPICVYMFKRDIDRRDLKAKEAEEARKHEEEVKKAKEQAAHEAFRSEMKEMIKPVVADVADIKKDLSEQTADLNKVKSMLQDNEAATILELRVDMKLTRDQHVNEGKELDTGDIATWKELYKKYYKMGGNHFKEFVDGWGMEIGLTSDELQRLKDEAIMENLDEHGR